MLNTMALQLLGEAFELNYLYYLDSTSVYMFETLSYVALIEVHQNPAVIYSISRFAELIQSNRVQVKRITLQNRA